MDLQSYQKLPVIVTPEFFPNQDVFTIVDGSIVEARVLYFLYQDNGPREMAGDEVHKFENQGFYNSKDRDMEIVYHLEVRHPKLGGGHCHVTYNSGIISNTLEGLLRKLKKNYQNDYIKS